MRRIIYGLSLWLFLAASICTIVSIALPNWITYHSPSSGSSSPITISYGLHKRCSSLTGTCTQFPSYNDCVGSEDRKFCSVWRSVGFAMNFSVVLELASVVAYVTVLVGGRRSREEGWKVLGGILGLVAVGQMVAMAFVAYLYDHDNRFFVGWELDKSWILCTVSWTVFAVNALGLVAGRFLLPPEDDYEAIPDPRR